MDEVEEIINFIIKEGNGVYNNIDKGRLKGIIQKHLEYGTAMVIRDKTGIMAVARWNLYGEDILTALVLDAVVREDYRKPLTLRQMVALGVSKNPSVKFICFKRESKYPDRDIRIYSVDRFLKRRIK
ncbi:hypothetical protein AYK26_07730 [Euryarchaeota archaeon SM23-78]|nr:MAG: hypothetical protein AYK26_07730 [Euryarchaeota archaeon SM23-78]